MSTTIDGSCTSGLLSGSSTPLILSGAEIIQYVLDGFDTHTGSLGTFSLITPNFSSGNLQAGGVMGAGGVLTISIPDQSILAITPLDAGATWTLIVLGGNTHAYVIEGTATNSVGSVAFVIQTSNIGAGFWNGSSGITSIQFHSTVEFLQSLTHLPPKVGTFYIPNFHRIPWTQPGGPGTTVFPTQENQPWANYPVPGQFFSENSGLFQVGCGHSVDYPFVFTDVGVVNGIRLVAVCCPLCSYIQYYMPEEQYYDLSSNSATPITLI